MQMVMAKGAKGDQVLLFVSPNLTPELKMMHLEVLHPATELTSPSVTLQNLTV